ncbi:unnamed protein product [Ostreobium quekettii]|uniref:Uncharacterized protein n=1 Tax=Ostreobium quekettii TaxID=121088 RepID=A0A8S1JF29_9CHLO|nr:unnamed protein product [Ostreobium quekettii]|eukprot:evm.model.scf_1360EXC.3 EVM.evm.TU.scf_1360EXC.3   scf_1360EXC:23414-24360(+)
MAHFTRQDWAGADEAPRRPRLKILGHLARAVKRFQASLNPKVSFGRRPSPVEESSVGVPMHFDARRTVSAPTRGGMYCHSEYERAVTGLLPVATEMPTPRYIHKDRGHITSYLFAPLPALPSEMSRA